ncbi:MAG: FAD-dependent thymidylate synthase [Candidatus Portnoybacteria bacterium]|nr:FAD-dependent thymidylate synthase [Candidatus Portnoybacteria bacterium]
MSKQAALERFAKPITVLDHGFVKLVDLMGDDDAIVSAARVSYDAASTQHTRGARGLIRYLMRHHHDSPTEMCEIKVMIRAPIVVARQFVRHRTASWNEISGRYSEMPDLTYVPEPSRICRADQHDRQGSGEPFDVTTAQHIRSIMMAQAQDEQLHYEDLLGQGVARETARLNLPLCRYTQWYWKIDLRNLLHFIHLRMDHHAQYEIRVYAEALWRIVQAWVPLTAEAFMDYVLDAMTFSGPEWRVLSRCLDLNAMDDDTVPGSSDGERREFQAKINPQKKY